MAIILVGLNHHTAPVELREQFYLAEYGVRSTLEALTASGLDECVIVSTCNRLEIYAVVDNPATGFEAITHYLSNLHRVQPAQLMAYLYLLQEEQAVEHLMRVACGLDSLVLGEAQILGQVSQALANAQAVNAVGSLLSHLLNDAIHIGKRARTETGISRHTVSVSHAAAQLAEQQIGDLGRVQALVIGAGEMAKLAARALQMHGAHSIHIISRTFASADNLARELGVEALEWHHLTDALANADLVISATGAPHTVIHAHDMLWALEQRGGQPVFMVDVAVPRDIDEAVGALPGVWLYDIDDLQMVVDHNRAQRQLATLEVEQIIQHGVTQFLAWMHSREVVPTLVDLRRKAEALVEAEVEEALRKLPGLDARDQQIVTKMAYRIANKLLHAPTTALKSQAAHGNSTDYVETVRELFALNAVTGTASEKS